MTHIRIVRLPLAPLLLVLVFLSWNQPVWAQQPTLPYVEDFETDGLGSRYTASNIFYDGSNDHFQRTDGVSSGQVLSNVSAPYSGIEGTYFWAGEDLDDGGGDGLPVKTLTLQEVDVSGATELRFLGRFAAGCNEGEQFSCYDLSDSLVVRYSTDGGATYTTGLQFSYVQRTTSSGSIDGFNEPLAVDGDFDGNGEGVELKPEMARFGFDIPTPASSVIIQIEAHIDGAAEEFAFDDLRLEPVALPVELSAFNAVASEATAVLTWKTLSETNNAGFHVLHQAPGSTDWASIGFLDGAGTISEPRSYRFESRPLSGGTHQFRLRQVDIDGTATLSDPKMVRIQETGKLNIEGANPVRAGRDIRVSVRTNESQQIEVDLYNVLGQRVRLVMRGAASASGIQTTVSTADLATGVYFFQLRSQSGVEVRRITVVR
ncbi:hypothetical protein CRI94_14425 [Longibacter salinarum]|uniref:Secretion system C-terminal sorting domain-containing protein n=1 Tax=Longibacter salinarum TaxID=1850348 RepID=A0A2A8CUH5_9BACT|nr:T9SS type A sorting domain-containing protein [Longibacter salinarum]PEN12232.1 hypothetical protein CRI94_14425 [Longibacter salinarum]